MMSAPGIPQRVIEETLVHSSCTREETNHFEYTDAEQGFYALLGSIMDELSVDDSSGDQECQNGGRA